MATLLGALTEPLIPALLKTLLDRGFSQGAIDESRLPQGIHSTVGLNAA